MILYDQKLVDERGTLINEFLQSYASSHETTADALKKELESSSKIMEVLHDSAYIFSMKKDFHGKDLDTLLVLTSKKNGDIADVVNQRNGVTVKPFTL